MFSSSVFSILYGKVKRLNNYCVTGLKFISSISSLTQSPTSTNKGDLYISNVEGTLTNFGGQTVKQGDGLIYNGSGWDKITYSELIKFQESFIIKDKYSSLPSSVTKDTVAYVKEDEGGNKSGFYAFDTNTGLWNIVGSSGGSGELTQDITANIDVGNTKSGFVFRQGMTFDDYVQAVHVAYLQPVVTLTPLGQTYEIGTNVTPFTSTINVTKKSNDIAKVELYLDSTLVKSSTTLTNGGSLSDLISPTSNDTDFSVIAKVNDGRSTVTKTNNFKFVRYGFYGTDSTNTVCGSSSEVRALSKNLVNPKANDKFTVQAKAGDSRITIAIPSNLTITSAKYVEGMGAESKDVFTKTVVNVEGKNNYSGINYNIYTYIVPSPFTSVYTLEVTLG